MHGESTIDINTLMFNGFFSALLGAISIGLELQAKKGKEETSGDSVIPSIVLSGLAYAGLASVWPEPLTHLNLDTKTFMSIFFRAVVSTILVIFATGPVKVWLDVKRGKTSIEEMKENYEDQRGWLHSRLGADNRPGLFPESQRQGQNLRRRNVDPNARDNPDQ